MATNWPNSVQTFTNPTSGSALNSPSHADQHATVNDTVEALQNYAGLVFVKSVTIGSGVSSVTVTDAFDSRFQNYRIIINAYGSVSAPFTLSLSGVTGSTDYDSKLFYSAVYASSGLTAVVHASKPEWLLGYINAADGGAGIVDIFRPNEDTRIYFSSRWSSYVAGFADGRTQPTTATSSTHFTLGLTSGTYSSGTIRVYGYNNG